MAEGARAAPFPGFVDPCVPVERKAPPRGDTWLHEIKHDGYRAQAHFHEGAAAIFTSDASDWAARMPTIAASLRALPVNNAILDGELVAVDAAGKAVSYELPPPMPAKPTRIKARLIYYAFDLLYLDGFDLRSSRWTAASEYCRLCSRALLACSSSSTSRISPAAAMLSSSTHASWGLKASSQSAATAPIGPAAAPTG